MPWTMAREVAGVLVAAGGRLSGIIVCVQSLPNAGRGKIKSIRPFARKANRI